MSTKSIGLAIGLILAGLLILRWIVGGNAASVTHHRKVDTTQILVFTPRSQVQYTMTLATRVVVDSLHPDPEDRSHNIVQRDTLYYANAQVFVKDSAGKLLKGKDGNDSSTVTVLQVPGASVLADFNKRGY